MLNKKSIRQIMGLIFGCFLFLLGFLLSLILIGGSFFDLSLQDHHRRFDVSLSAAAQAQPGQGVAHHLVEEHLRDRLRDRF